MGLKEITSEFFIWVGIYTWVNIPDEDKEDKNKNGAPPFLLWAWHRLQNISYEGSRVIFYSRCHTQRRIGGAPARQSFFGNDNDKDLKVCFPVMCVICFLHLSYMCSITIDVSGCLYRLYTSHGRGSDNQCTPSGVLVPWKPGGIAAENDTCKHQRFPEGMAAFVQPYQQRMYPF